MRMRNAKRRDDAKENAGEHRDSRSEKQHVTVDSDCARTRQLYRHQLHRGVRRGLSKDQAKCAAAQSEEQTFGEKLACHAATSCAQRHADGKLAGASRGTS